MDKLLQSPLNPEILLQIQKLTQFKERWSFLASPSRDLYASLKKTTIITSAGASTRIEGSKLSDEEIEKRLTGLEIQHIRDRDEAEVAGYIDCKKYIFDNYRDLEISTHTIRSLHQMMMAYLPHEIMPQDQRGAYKNITNSVVRQDWSTGAQEIIFETTPPGPQTETAMQRLVEHYRAYIKDPNYMELEVIAAFVVIFLAIHPFRDGNGRMSRLLTDLCLLRQGYEFCMYSSNEKVIEDNKEAYYIALRQTQGSFKMKSDINPWFFYFLKVLEQQTRYLEKNLLPKKSGTLTPLQNQVYELIKNNQPVTFGFLRRESGQKISTLKNILVRLRDEELIQMEGRLKGSRYSLKKRTTD